MEVPQESPFVALFYAFFAPFWCQVLRIFPNFIIFVPNNNHNIYL